MGPYEWYFYSSGGREEGWKGPDLVVNRGTVFLGWHSAALSSPRWALACS